MLNSIEEALEDFKLGKMLIVVDDEDRENEGDLVIASDMVKDEDITFMLRYAGGLICTPMAKDLLDRLNIKSMVYENTDSHNTAFTVSVDYIDTTTGISSKERALTIKKLIDKNSTEHSFKRPGHVFPLAAKEGGVLVRNGHTEAGVDLARICGFSPSAVICEIVKDNGEMARLDDLIKFSKCHNIKIVSIKDLIEYRLKNENLMLKVSDSKMPTKYGDFRIYGFENKLTKDHHIAIVKGNIENKDSVLCRIHSECFTGDILGSMRCDCGNQLQAALKLIEENESGVVVYMRQEGRGIGLLNKIKAYNLQDNGLDTVEANLALGLPVDSRTYYEACHILKKLNIKNIRLMTNNPDKIKDVEKYDINVNKRVILDLDLNEKNKDYLKTKQDKLGHLYTV
ncbi:bifunctional 3,4-dihydroxy-2-butanone-4-phosphate synthase/GTP cyclohydrolase II [Romboutsia sp. 1001713B170207_170306_H8]|uniref:bifunctional 3,4-dihydroxy-2-butanone-4-phosphate synthase/GTP cyclohydrolase II n=1 Tax=Romboutsia sp. 1001713B170207_170306_H8 TaxID=2787112 RepID=UPI00189748B2|nr:bifunctional 3,4-dihydroxy-2-butanone-4-phosphate synthase/GTP cyclohydrolase II [Romboutsia sp. 1001713B170207_170306_H8]